MPGWSGCDVCGLKLYGVELSIYLHDPSGERLPQPLPPGEYELIPVAVEGEAQELRRRPDAIRVVVTAAQVDGRDKADDRGDTRPKPNNGDGNE